MTVGLLIHTNQNLQRHHAALPVVARLSCLLNCTNFPELLQGSSGS